uniref:UDP-glucose 4-epimerase n=1 Tax=Candidatus Kentrum sp. FM TaxID=2126340 RepID=A0A450VUU4_9GAMM|nr:MAG: UDP-arabinose 4-epimerase [Candidatus Kentron sp. FM]VFJ65404.1 MAG: UDP-arabinose 4-epimerase [Candidatus Kentron sp. FM]VFK08578.1 MAG: UDP-arabinose 4-epimerase [Candidatus Kentron sp. FM]
MNILVTGGAGYVGSHACKALARAGFTPVTYDNMSRGHPWAVKWGPLEEGDIARRARLDEVIRRYRPMAVMHFAALAYVGESVLNPGGYYRNNVAGTLTLLEALRDHGIHRIIFSSTCAIYGIPEKIPMDEGHPQQPINPYGASKRMVERILSDFRIAHGLRSMALRYFNAAGADPEGEIGEAHDPETHLIPLLLQSALGQRSATTIFGDDYDTPDGTCIRDYIHVTDLARAHVLALQALEQGADSGAYNLGNGQGFSVREIIEHAGRVTGCPIPVEIGPRRAGDPPRLIGDASRMRKELGWQPRYSDPDTILATAWRWHRAFADGCP